MALFDSVKDLAGDVFDAPKSLLQSDSFDFLTNDATGIIGVMRNGNADISALGFPEFSEIFSDNGFASGATTSGGGFDGIFSAVKDIASGDSFAALTGGSKGFDSVFSTAQEFLNGGADKVLAGIFGGDGVSGLILGKGGESFDLSSLFGKSGSGGLGDVFGGLQGLLGAGGGPNGILGGLDGILGSMGGLSGVLSSITKILPSLSSLLPIISQIAPLALLAL